MLLDCGRSMLQVLKLPNSFHTHATEARRDMKHLYFYYLLGVINFRYNRSKDTYTTSSIISALKVILHIIVPNALLLWISVIGKSGILLTVPSVHIMVFFMRISFTVLTMNVNVVLNYYVTNKQQIALLDTCRECFRQAKSFNPGDGTKNPSFRGSLIVLGIFLLHYANYELNQYTYVILYDEKWPELTFYVVFYFIEMITVMHALYYASVLEMIRLGVRLDCAQLSKCLEQNRKHDSSGSFDDSYWWRTIEHFYSRLLDLHERKKNYCRTFRVQLVTIALNTFICSFSIFYVNLNSILAYNHDNWLEKYKRVTECSGFFSQLGALLLLCRHATELEGEQHTLTRLILRAQLKLREHSSNMKRGDLFNSRILILQSKMKIAPYDLFDYDMEYFFGMVAAIVTYLVVLFQFRALE